MKKLGIIIASVLVTLGIAAGSVSASSIPKFKPKYKTYSAKTIKSYKQEVPKQFRKTLYYFNESTQSVNKVVIGKRSAKVIVNTPQGKGIISKISTKTGVAVSYNKKTKTVVIKDWLKKGNKYANGEDSISISHLGDKLYGLEIDRWSSVDDISKDWYPLASTLKEPVNFTIGNQKKANKKYFAGKTYGDDYFNKGTASGKFFVIDKKLKKLSFYYTTKNSTKLDEYSFKITKFKTSGKLTTITAEDKDSKAVETFQLKQMSYLKDGKVNIVKVTKDQTVVNGKKIKDGMGFSKRVFYQRSGNIS
ncbi:hypothetical protein EQG49_06850 [Periweissella cryptocerci]|uniref:Uncharacterized protein n=1 Tax=Periweissella cryptocerci TaxID=2506420 RepID=A0A4P6YU52_9LACO|nr:hypothetical protein [Periweissella cryptocerci]QBO36197.1 hypothetical protein EQG49_06850 [Periweissella cryptocerci]